ncbi:MAG: xanthine dehydrogenase family protein molybdopterin-binding subunit, partial [Gaiellaceae bacterium]
MTVTEEQRAAYVGTTVARKEDPKLLTGQGRFTENLSVPGMVWAVLVRSPYAHARIRSVDTSGAREAEGVVAAFSGADLAGEWAGPLPMAWPVTEDTKNPPHWPLTPDK